MSLSFDLIATETFCTYRCEGTDPATGLDYDPVPIIVSGRCTPLDPVNPKVVQEYGLEHYETLQTMARGGLDVREGDLFQPSCSGIVISGVPEDGLVVKMVGDWKWRPTALDTIHIVIQDVKE